MLFMFLPRIRAFSLLWLFYYKMKMTITADITHDQSIITV